MRNKKTKICSITPFPKKRRLRSEGASGSYENDAVFKYTSLQRYSNKKLETKLKIILLELTIFVTKEKTSHDNIFIYFPD